jgi:pimeloyl-ACP methyl ester carboxylesterase
VLAVSAALPDEASDRPAIVLIHGAANSARVWTFWQQELARRGWPAYALDLRGHGASTPLDLSRTTMTDYADDVSALVGQLAANPVVMGWSMGGLAALIAAARGGALAYVGLAPSPPARARHTSPTLRSGVFGAEEYGIVSGDPGDQPAMPDLDLEERAIALASLGPESRHARDDRRAGIVIADLPCRRSSLPARPIRRSLAAPTTTSRWPRSSSRPRAPHTGGWSSTAGYSRR